MTNGPRLWCPANSRWAEAARHSRIRFPKPASRGSSCDKGLYRHGERKPSVPDVVAARLGWRLVGAVLARVCAAAERDQPGRLVWSAEPAAKLSLERRYRADAQVLLFGITLLRREDVGGGSVFVAEYEAGGAARLLEFNGYSTPAERLA